MNVVNEKSFDTLQEMFDNNSATKLTNTNIDSNPMVNNDHNSGTSHIKAKMPSFDRTSVHCMKKDIDDDCLALEKHAILTERKSAGTLNT